MACYDEEVEQCWNRKSFKAVKAHDDTDDYDPWKAESGSEAVIYY